MGRLQFWIEGIDKHLGVFQIDTKSWHSVEKIEAVLSLYPDPRGIPFLLKVEMQTKGRDHFPVLTLEADVKVSEEEILLETPADMELADRYVQLRKALDAYSEQRVMGDEPSEEQLVAVKGQLCLVLDVTTPDWRNMPALIARLTEVGAPAAAAKMLEAVSL